LMPRRSIKRVAPLKKREIKFIVIRFVPAPESFPD
jgi:hypothetical protein